MAYGIQPGPRLFMEHPDVFWSVIISMYLGNVVLLILNLPLIGIWVRLLRVPYRWLFPSIIMFCCIGNYSVSNNPVDIYLCALIGVLGYVLHPDGERVLLVLPPEYNYPQGSNNPPVTAGDTLVYVVDILYAAAQG